MHFSFIPYGKRDEVELMLRDMEAQKHKLSYLKNGKVRAKWIQSQVRLLPFGIYEYIFPKEDRDIVLNTMIHENKITPYLSNLRVAVLRKMIGHKKLPKTFEQKSKYLWIKENVSVVPLGFKEDGVIKNPSGEIHEAI